ncbi:MAG: hypothetical protein ACMUIU_06145 [bacterium]
MQGYPGVLRRWLDKKCGSLEDLRETARDALLCRYPEFKGIYKKLKKEEADLFNAALYYTLAPELNSNERWDELAQTISGVDHERSILELQEMSILREERPYPYFGPTIRYQVAQYTAVESFKPRCIITIKKWRSHLESKNNAFLFSVAWYVSELLETIDPEEKQRKISRQIAIIKMHEDVSPFVSKEIAKIR